MQLEEIVLAYVKLDDEWWLRNDSLQYRLGVWLDRDTSAIPSVKNMSSKGSSAPVHFHTALEDRGCCDSNILKSVVRKSM